MSGVDIGKVSGSIDLSDTFTSKLNAVVTALGAAGSRIDAFVAKMTTVSTSATQAGQQMSSGIAGGANQIKASLDAVQTSVGNYKSQIDDLNAAIKMTGDRQGQLKGILDDTTKQYTAAQQQAKALEDQLQELSKTPPLPPVPPEFTADLKKAGQAAVDLGRGMKEAGVLLSAAFTVPIVGAAAAAVEFGSSFQTQMTRVVTLAGASSQEVAGLRDQVLALGTATGVGPDELAKGLFVLESFGQRGAEAMDTLTVAAKMSAIGMGSVEDAAHALTGILFTYKEQNLSAAQAADILTRAVQLGNMKIADLVPAIAKVNGVAAAMGVKFQDIAAAIATFTHAGVDASVAATGIRAILNSILTDSNKTEKGFKDLSAALGDSTITMANFRKEIDEKGLTVAMVDLANNVTKAGEAGVHAFGEIIPNIRGLAEALTVYKINGDFALNILQQLNDAHGTLGHSVEELEKTWAQKWNEIKISLEAVAIRLSDVLLPKMMELAKFVLDDLIPALTSLVDWFTKLPTFVQGTLIAVMGFLAILGPGVIVLGEFAMALGNLAKAAALLSGLEATAGISGLVAFCANPFVLGAAAVLGGIALAIYEVNKNLANAQHISTIGQNINGAPKTIDANGKPMLTVQNAQSFQPPAALLDSGKQLEIIIPSMQHLGTATADTAKATQTLLEKVGQLTEAEKALIVQDQAQKLNPKQISADMLSRGFSVGADVIGVYEKQLAALNKTTGTTSTAFKELLDRMNDNQKATGEFQKSWDTITFSIDTSGNVVKGFHGQLVALLADMLELTKSMAKITEVGFADSLNLPSDARMSQFIGGITNTTKALTDFGVHYQTYADESSLAKKTIEGLGDNFNISSANRLSGWLKDTNVLAGNATLNFKTLGDALGGLSKDFTQLATISGSSFGNIAKDIGLAVKAGEDLTKVLDFMSKVGTGEAPGGWNPQNLAALAAGWLGVAVAIYSVVDSIIKAKEAADKLNAAIAFAGAVQQDFSNAQPFTQSLTDSIQTTETSLDALAKALFAFQQANHDLQFFTVPDNAADFGRQLAEALHLTDVIKELGGVSHLTTDQMKLVDQEIGDLFGLAAQGGANAIAATKSLDDTFVAFGAAAVKAGGFVNQTFLDGIKNAKALGITLEGTAAFLLTQGQSAATGLTSMFGGLDASAKAAASQKVKDAGGSDADAKKAADNTGFSVTSSTQAAGLGASVAGSFAAMVKNGSSMKDALTALSGPIATLDAALAKSGFDGGAAFGRIGNMAKIANDAITGPLVDAIEGARQAMLGLGNSGMLNQSMFSALSGTATDAYKQILAQGKDGDAALQLMQPTLQTMWEAEQQFGFTTDAATQALIDQGVQQGIVGEAGKDAQGKILDVLLAIADALGATIPAGLDTLANKSKTTAGTFQTNMETAAQKSQDAMNALKAPTLNGTVNYHVAGLPAAPPGFHIGSAQDPGAQWDGDIGQWIVPGAMTGGMVVPSGIQHFMGGGIAGSTDTVRAMLTPGEMVLTASQQTAIAALLQRPTGSASRGATPLGLTAQNSFGGGISDGSTSFDAMTKAAVQAAQTMNDAIASVTKTIAKDPDSLQASIEGTTQSLLKMKAPLVDASKLQTGFNDFPLPGGPYKPLPSYPGGVINDFPMPPGAVLNGGSDPSNFDLRKVTGGNTGITGGMFKGATLDTSGWDLLNHTMSGATRYLADGTPPFTPKGTDTVPAMYTPGETVRTPSAEAEVQQLLGRQQVVKVVAGPHNWQIVVNLPEGTDATDPHAIAKAANMALQFDLESLRTNVEKIADQRIQAAS